MQPGLPGSSLNRPIMASKDSSWFRELPRLCRSFRVITFPAYPSHVAPIKVFLYLKKLIIELK